MLSGIRTRRKRYGSIAIAIAMAMAMAIEDLRKRENVPPEICCKEVPRQSEDV